MNERAEYVTQILRQRGFTTEDDLRETAARQAEQMEALDKRQARARQMEQAVNEEQMEYQQIKASVPELYKTKLLWGRLDARPHEEEAARQELRESLQDEFSDAEYRAQLKGTDKTLNGATEHPEARSKEETQSRRH